MKKSIRYLLSVILVVSMLSLIGCGGGGKAAKKNPYEGKWIAVVAEALGTQMPIEECFEGDVNLEIEHSGKVKFTIDNDKGTGKLAKKDEKTVLKIEGEEMSVTLDGDTLTLDDLLGQGVNIIFGREGTDATNPENYLSEDELAVIGEWYSENVKELLDEEAQTTLDGVDNINDAMRLNFAKDRTVQVIYKGAELGTYPWSALYGLCNRNG
ncbi:hypothetical protein [Blautia stercoris]